MSAALEIRSADRVLLLAPHPDDETLAAGGLLQHAVAADAAVRVVYATDGENNPWAQRAVEHRWRVGDVDRRRWGLRRRCEALTALARLGVADHAVTFLGLPDQGLTDELLEPRRGAVRMLASAIANDPPTILLSPASFDVHPDHSALAVLLRLALARMAPHVRWPLVLEYLVHGRRRAPGYESNWHVALSGEQIICKRAAIRAHASQVVLRKRGLLAFATRYESFFTPSRRASADASHPIRAAAVDGQTLRLHFRPDVHRWASRNSTLYLAIDGCEGGSRWRARLPSATETIEVAQLGPRKRVVPAVSVTHREGRELRLPLGIFRDATAVFAKVERRFGFFDEAGWREISLPPRRRIHPELGMTLGTARTAQNPCSEQRRRRRPLRRRLDMEEYLRPSSPRR